MLYTPGVGNNHSDLCAIVAKISGIDLPEKTLKIEEVKSSELQKKSAIPLTLPSLELSENN